MAQQKCHPRQMLIRRNVFAAINLALFVFRRGFLKAFLCENLGSSNRRQIHKCHISFFKPVAHPRAEFVNWKFRTPLAKAPPMAIGKFGGK
jgi:hypothetical protein